MLPGLDAVRLAMRLILYCSRSSSITPPDCMQGWIDVLVGLPSSDWILSGGLPLLLEEWKEGMVRMDTAWAIVAALS